MRKLHEVSVIIFFVLLILIYDACQEMALNSYSSITVKLIQSERVESWSFRFVKVDTTLDNVVKVDKDFNISFTQADTLVISDSTQLFFVAGIDTIEEIIVPDSSFYQDDSLIVIEYKNPEFTKGIWYLTMLTRFKDHSGLTFWSKPVWFEIVNIVPVDSLKDDLEDNEIH